MIVYEFFSGTRSLTRPFEKAGHPVYSFENDPQFEATETVDIRDLSPGYLLNRYGRPRFVWASTPCTAYSVGSFRHHFQCETPCLNCGQQLARVGGEKWQHLRPNGEACDSPRVDKKRNVYTPKSPTGELGVELLMATLSLIRDLQPYWWIVENGTGTRGG